jgi:hypothetical protein
VLGKTRKGADALYAGLEEEHHGLGWNVLKAARRLSRASTTLAHAVHMPSMPHPMHHHGSPKKDQVLPPSRIRDQADAPAHEQTQVMSIEDVLSTPATNPDMVVEPLDHDH